MSFSEFCVAHENRMVPNWMIRYFNGLNDTNLWDYYESYKYVISVRRIVFGPPILK